MVAWDCLMLSAFWRSCSSKPHLVSPAVTARSRSSFKSHPKQRVGHSGHVLADFQRIYHRMVGLFCAVSYIGLDGLYRRQHSGGVLALRAHARLGERAAREEPYGSEGYRWLLRPHRGHSGRRDRGLHSIRPPKGADGFLGLVPSEYSTGERHHRGDITKTGDAHARRVLKRLELTTPATRKVQGK